MPLLNRPIDFLCAIIGIDLSPIKSIPFNTDLVIVPLNTSLDSLPVSLAIALPTPIMGAFIMLGANPARCPSCLNIASPVLRGSLGIKSRVVKPSINPADACCIALRILNGLCIRLNLI